MSLFDQKSLFSLRSKSALYTKLKFPVQLAPTLLQRTHCQNLLDTLQIVLPQEVYLKYYYPAIEQYAHYVQMLPAFPTGLFSEIEGLLNYSLSRATYTLITALSYLYPNQKTFQDLSASEEEAAELYAVFTAALFKEVSVLIHSYTISLFDTKELKKKIWNPFDGAVIELSDIAFLSFQYIHKPTQLAHINSCLTSIILSSHTQTRPGFLLISRYPHILELWLSALSDEAHLIPSTAAMSLIPFGEKQAIEKRLEDKRWIQEKIRSKLNHTFKELEEMRLGKQFLAWLRAKVKAGDIPINTEQELGLRRTKNGLWIARSELLNFCKLQQVNAEVVETQLKAIMASYPLSANERGRLSGAIGGIDQIGLHKWLLIHNPALIFSAGQVPPIFLSQYRTYSNYTNNVPITPH